MSVAKTGAASRAKGKDDRSDQRERRKERPGAP